MRVIGEFSPDCIHVNGALFAGRAARRAGRLAGIPVVGTNHLMPENILLNLPGSPNCMRLSSVIWRRIVSFFNQCDYVTAPTETARMLMLEHGLTQASSVISNGVDVERFHASGPATAHGKLRMCYLGRVNREKGLETLIRAMTYLSDRRAHLYVVGSGNDAERLSRLTDRLGVREAITFTGEISEEGKPNLLRQMDLFVMPSAAELQSISTLEAMASGLPLIAARVGAMPEACQDGVNGALYTYGDPKSLALAVAELSDSPRSAMLMGMRSRRIAEQSHSDHITAAAYERLYRQLCGESRRLRPAAI